MSFVFRVLLVIVLSGCSAPIHYQVGFNPAERLRVMVLPFAQVDDSGEFIEMNPKVFLDAVPLVSTKLEDTPPEFIRRLVYDELAETSLDPLAPYLVNVELPHYGFGKTDGSFDLKKIHSAAPSALCVEFLDCDAVLYGRVTKWKRAYYALETVNAVGIELKLVSARSAKVLYEASGTDSVRRGLSKGPTGFTDLVLEPIRGLNSEIITDLSRRLVKKLLAPLTAAQPADTLAAPLPAIYATSHDRLSGSLEPGGHLTVLAFGTEKNAAVFSIGPAVRNVPMLEIEPGHYFGEYHPLSSDSFQNQPVMVTLTDALGRSTSQQVTAAPLNYPSFAGRAKLE